MTAKNKRIWIYATAIIIPISILAIALNILCKDIKYIYYTNDKNGESPDISAETVILDKIINRCDFVCYSSNYSIAENQNEYCLYCGNQYLTVSAESYKILYYCYDRDCKGVYFSERECEAAALAALRDCRDNGFFVRPACVFCAFDGKTYTFGYQLCGQGNVTVKVWADSKKIALIDALDIDGI